jgi:glycosyltransferase involved in cell wall biosynthesis
VRFHGRRPPQEAWSLAAGAWAGLSLLEATPAFVAAVPSKLYEYLACGLAAVVSPLPRQADLVRESGAGEIAASSREAAEILERWAAEPALVDAHAGAGRAYAATALGPGAYDDLAARVAELARR